MFGVHLITVTANSNFSQYNLTLPASLPQQVTYEAPSGGPLAIASLQWLNNAGTVLSTSDTPAQVAGTAQSRPLTRPVGATSFCVNFASSAPASVLRVSINSAASTILNVAAGDIRTCATETDTLERLADRKTLTNG